MRLSNVEHLVGVVFSTGGWREELPIFLVDLYRFVHNLAERRKHRLLVVPMTASIQQPWTTADKALIFL